MIRAVKRLARAVWWLLCSSRRRPSGPIWTMTEKQKAQFQADFQAIYKRRYKKIRKELGDCLQIGKLPADSDSA